MDNDFLLRVGAQWSTSVMFGIGAAGSIGVAPMVGGAMATTAYLATAVAFKAIEKILNRSNIKNSYDFIGSAALAASWIASATQISQIASKAFLFTSVPFSSSLYIVTASLLVGGQVFGNLLTDKIFDEDIDLY